MNGVLLTTFSLLISLLGFIASIWPLIFGQRTFPQVLQAAWAGLRARRMMLSPFRVAILAISLAALVVSATFLYQFSQSNVQHSSPGGEWRFPVDNQQQVQKSIRLVVLAYPSHQGDPSISYIQFTAYWAGLAHWKTICIALLPAVQIAENAYACDWEPGLWKAPPGNITISFDVHDDAGNIHNAPNAEHIILFHPIL